MKATAAHPIERDPEAFPRAGFRARRWQRFERDLAAWLASPEGRFAVWRARRPAPRHAQQR